MMNINGKYSKIDTPDLKKAKETYDKIKMIESIDMDDAYKRTRSKISILEKSQFVHRLMRYAAVLAIPLFLATIVLSVLMFQSDKFNKNQVAEVMVPLGTIVKYDLPDGSVVWLNSGSKLQYPIRFTDKKREVILDGEAYFSVESNKENPFYVHTPYGISTYVYGTEFNVDAYSKDNKMEVTLIRGSLNVINHRLNEQTKLTPGNLASLSNGYLKVEKTDIDEKSGWKNGELVFRQASLLEILNKLERHYNVEIVLENPEGKSTVDYSIRAIFRNETIDQIMDYLSASIKLKWTFIDENQALNRRKIKVII